MYIKFIPENWDENTIREKFKKFGPIHSMSLKKNQHGKFAFICFNDPKDMQVGFKAAEKAIAEMNKLKVEGGQELFVNYHQNKSNRKS